MTVRDFWYKYNQSSEKQRCKAARYRLMENQLMEMSFHISERSIPQMVSSASEMLYFPGRFWWLMESGQKFNFLTDFRMIPEDFPFRATVR